MFIGILEATIAVANHGGIKGKRSVVRRLLDRSQSRFNVAAAEVGLEDHPQRALLGFSVISGDGRHARSMIDSLFDFLLREARADLLAERREIIQLGDEFGSEMRSMADAERAKRNE